MPSILETRQLILRPVEERDLDQIQREFAQWEIVRYLAAQVPWPYPADGAVTWYRTMVEPQTARGEGWYWTMRPKVEPEVVAGVISLLVGEETNRGFWVARRWQRRGFASEAADAVTDFWFDVLGFPRLRVPKAADNLPSRRISERQGMRVVATGEKDHVGGRMRSELWELTADEWHGRRR